MLQYFINIVFGTESFLRVLLQQFSNDIFRLITDYEACLFWVRISHLPLSNCFGHVVMVFIVERWDSD